MGTTQHFCTSILAVALVLGAVQARADLQNVEAGGSITMLGEYYTNTLPVATDLRHDALSLRGRAIGSSAGAGNGLISGFGWDDAGGDTAFVTQWTRLGVKADFTEGVAAIIELDSVDVWGEDFRSNWVTGADARAWSGDDVEIYQAYVEANALFGLPLRLRIGRQEMAFGSEWLVGNGDSGPAPAWGLSFDGLRFTYAVDTFSLDAFWMKLLESGAEFGDGDIDFYGLYGSYTGFENFVLDAYWLYLRDDRPIDDDTGPLDVLENLFGVDDYDTTEMHTVGLRAAGALGAFYFESEMAYQFGDAGAVGALFMPGIYGDNDAEFDNFGANLELGYTFDAAWSPTVYLGYAYLGGEDKRDISFLQLLESMVNPYYTAPASISFNRLFSDWSYSPILDGSDLSNMHIFRGGIAAAATEKLELGFDLIYMRTDAAFERPVVPGLSFWTADNDKELGLEATIHATYNYSEDVYFVVAWDHLFVEDGLAKGHFNNLNGLDFNGGSGDDDADYIAFEMGLCF